MSIPKPAALIIGVGNSGCSIAVELCQHGIGHFLWAAEDHRRIFDKIKKQRQLEATGDITGIYHPILTTNLCSALPFVQAIFVVVPSYAHIIIQAELAQHDLSEHHVIFICGNFVAPIADMQINAKTILVTDTAPHASRLEEFDNDKVNIHVCGIKRKLDIAALGAVDQNTCDFVSKFFSMPLHWHLNTLQLDLSGIHAILHGPLMLSNIGPIERQKNWTLYNDCMVKPVRTLIEAGDEQRLNLLKALGYPNMPSISQIFNALYVPPASDLQTFFRNCKVFNQGLKLPESMKARQVSQDIPYWCVPMACIGKAIGADVRIIEAWITTASAINGVDYWKTGRTLEAFGLKEDASKEEILQIFSTRRGYPT